MENPATGKTAGITRAACWSTYPTRHDPSHNVIKNLGIGLYLMQVASVGRHRWKYSVPDRRLPGIKAGIPHQAWEAEIDSETCATKRHDSVHYLVKKTAGMPGTMVDIIKAVAAQDILILHVVDAIESTSFDQADAEAAEKVAERLVFAGLDPVATDLRCTRNKFPNVSLEEASRAAIEDFDCGRRRGLPRLGRWLVVFPPDPGV